MNKVRVQDLLPIYGGYFTKFLEGGPAHDVKVDPIL